MSGQASGWVMRHGPCTTWAGSNGVRKDRSAQAVLLAIADASNRDGEQGHPGMAAMIDASGYSRSAVFSALDRLISIGYLEVTHDGRGRGNAVEYRIPGVSDPSWRPGEKVQTLDLAGTEKGPEPASKRSRPDSQKVQNQGSAPLSTTVSNGNTNGASAPDEAQIIAASEWERRKTAGEPQPLGGFVAFRSRIREALSAGHTAAAVRSALPSMTTFTRGSFEFALTPPKPKGAAAPITRRNQQAGRITL